MLDEQRKLWQRYSSIKVSVYSLSCSQMLTDLNVKYSLLQKEKAAHACFLPIYM